MRNIVIFLFILGTIFLSRNYIHGFILNFIEKRRNKSIDVIKENLSKGSVFSPSGTSRNFDITINLEEVGNGEVIFTVAKSKRGGTIDK